MARTKGARAKYSIERDRQILKLLSDGKSTKEMADAVFVSEGTMYNLLKQLFKQYKVIGKQRTKRNNLISIHKREKKIA